MRLRDAWSTYAKPQPWMDIHCSTHLGLQSAHAGQLHAGWQNNRTITHRVSRGGQLLAVSYQVEEEVAG
jgi:hypothetical protein